MSDFAIGAIAWTGLALHIIVGFVTLRSAESRLLVPLLNLACALAVLAYWGYRWFGYLFRSVTWYATDQVIPIYALLVCIVALMTLAGRYPLMVLNWVAYLIDVLVLAGAVLFLSFFRMNKLF